MARTRAFAALITPEDLCGEAAVPGSWDDEGQRTHPGGQGPDTAPVAVALPVFGAFMGLGFQVLGHPGFQALPIYKQFRGVILGLIIITYWPGLSLWLPRVLGMRQEMIPLNLMGG